MLLLLQLLLGQQSSPLEADSLLMDQGSGSGGAHGTDYDDDEDRTGGWGAGSGSGDGPDYTPPGGTGKLKHKLPCDVNNNKNHAAHFSVTCIIYGPDCLGDHLKPERGERRTLWGPFVSHILTLRVITGGTNKNRGSSGEAGTGRDTGGSTSLSGGTRQGPVLSLLVLVLVLTCTPRH